MWESTHWCEELQWHCLLVLEHSASWQIEKCLIFSSYDTTCFPSADRMSWAAVWSVHAEFVPHVWEVRLFWVWKLCILRPAKETVVGSLLHRKQEALIHVSRTVVFLVEEVLPPFSWKNSARVFGCWVTHQMTRIAFRSSFPSVQFPKGKKSHLCVHLCIISKFYGFFFAFYLIQKLKILEMCSNTEKLHMICLVSWADGVLVHSKCLLLFF